MIDLGNRDQLLAVGEEVFKAATNPADLANFILNAKSILQQPNLPNGPIPGLSPARASTWSSTPMK